MRVLTEGQPQAWEEAEFQEKEEQQQQKEEEEEEGEGDQDFGSLGGAQEVNLALIGSGIWFFSAS